MPATVHAAAAPTVTSRFADDAPRAMAKDSSYAASIIVRNEGTAIATGVELSAGASGDANAFSPTWGTHPKFLPELTYTAGCTTVSSWCQIGALAPGETRVVQVSVAKVTHFGTLKLHTTAWHAAGFDDHGYRSWNVQVTNGKSTLVQVDADAPRTAAGNSDVMVSGEISNAGPDAVDSGLLYFNATAIDDNGGYWNRYDGRTEMGTIRSLRLSDGTTCAAETDPISSKASPNRFVCAVNNLAANSRLSFEAVVNFPTTRTNFNVDVFGSFISTSHLASGSTTSFWKEIQLTPERTVDLETTLSSQGLIGGNRLAAVRVTVANRGNFRAEGVIVRGDARGGVGGVFAKDTLPSACVGVLKPIYARCGIGTIEAGQSASILLDVRAAQQLGLLAVTFSALHDGASVYDTNADNNVATATFQVVKANAVPFMGVGVFKPRKQNLGQLLRAGNRTTVACPSSCRAKVALQVKRSVAERLGLVRRTNARAGRAMPYIVIGTATKARAGKGKVVVVARVNRRFRAKLTKLRVPLTMSRVTTVTATTPGIRGASSTRTSSLTVRPARATRR